MQIVHQESGVSVEKSRALVELAKALRALDGYDLEEVVSTRLLVYCGSLIRSGMDLKRACRAAIVEPLTDDLETVSGLMAVVEACLGE